MFSILVLRDRWNIVGEVSRDGEFLVVDRCATIRYWGTTGGLGELAYHGPTSKTKLDLQPQTRVHIIGVVKEIRCNSSKWESALPDVRAK